MDVVYTREKKSARWTMGWKVSRGYIILVPIALFASLSRRGLGTRNEGLWRQRIFQSESGTSGLHVCSRDVSIRCLSSL